MKIIVRQSFNNAGQKVILLFLCTLKPPPGAAPEQTILFWFRPRCLCSKTDNDLKLYEFINTISRDYKNNLLLVGDLNWPNIDWKNWSSPKSLGSETKFLDILRKNCLLQYIDKPTRIRGDDEPHVLDLVLTNEPLLVLTF